MDEAVAGHATFIEVELSRRRLPDRHRQRPRHPGRSASEIPEEIGARSHHDARCMPAASSTPRSTRPPAACTASASRSSTRCRTISRSRSRAAASSTASAFRAACRRASWRSSARCTTAAARRSASIPTRRSSARAPRFEPARLYRMARSKAYLFGGVEIRWTCDPQLIKDKDETPAKAVFHFPGGLKDYLDGLARRRIPGHARNLRRQEREAGRPRLASNGRSPGIGGDGFLNSYCNTIPTARRRHARGRLPQRADARPARLCRPDRQQARRRSSPPTT